jgi:3-hydroxymyristoyl/3-hydroxydecanoyl-(acyl carrier protein) dehydratase
MADHFAAFSFVDRIIEYEAGRRARARYAVPADIDAFPSCLVAEAVGQLAAWVAMAHIGFRGRPVAALANETRFRSDVVPGSTLDLAVDIESCDEHAVAYAGHARVGDTSAIELVDCLGPMLPVEEFDSPDAMAARFDLIRGEGAPPGRFHGVPAARILRTGGVPGASAEAALHVPASAPFFGDHFPRRPVFPATLLLDAQIGLALALAAESPHWPAGTRPAASRMTHVKMRSFIPPGATLDIAAEMPPLDGRVATLRLVARLAGKTAATARLEVSAKEIES